MNERNPPEPPAVARGPEDLAAGLARQIHTPSPAAWTTWDPPPAGSTTSRSLRRAPSPRRSRPSPRDVGRPRRRPG
ncbi:hypothetical protein HBB16_06430 [Pseudonocardia sp. MCCB 268]|nr:hypothetical protein [Pseudonocardia cytotoxica]